MANSRLSAAQKAINALSGQLGVASSQLEKALKMAGLNPAKVDAKQAYAAYTKMKTGKAMDFVAPARPAVQAPASDKPAPLRQRLASDPNVRDAVASRADDLRLLDPKLAAKVAAGDPRAIVAAYRKLGTTPEDAIRQLRAAQPEQAAVESIANQFDRAVGRDDFVPDEPPVLTATGRGPQGSQPMLRRAAEALDSDMGRAGTAAAFGTGLALGLDALTSSGNPADLATDGGVNFDIHDAPDPFAPAPAEPVRVGNKFFHQNHFDWQPFGNMPAEAVGKPLIRSAGPVAAPPSAPTRAPRQNVISTLTTMDPLVMDREIARVLADVDRINSDPDPNRRWSQSDWDYAKLLIEENNARARQGLGGYRQVRNPFLVSDNAESDLTETGNPAELAVNPVAPAAASASVPAPRTMTSGVTPAAGPADVPTMRLAREPDNVASTLAASATPVMPDEELSEPAADNESLEDYGTRYGAALHARVGAGADERGRRIDPEQYGYNRDTGLSPTEAAYRNGFAPVPAGDTVMVDGYQVPVVRNSVGNTLGVPGGQQYYRLGDLKAAQDAEREARWLAGHRAMVDADNAKYGHYSIKDTADELTPEQEQARDARKRAETNQYAQVQRQRAFQIANKDRELTPYEQQQKERRDMVAARAKLVGGSQNLNATTRSRLGTLDELANPQLNDWQRMVLAETMLREPQQVTPLGVQGNILRMAAGLANNANVGSALADANNLRLLQMQQQQAADERMRTLTSIASKASDSSVYTLDARRRKADRALRNHGTTPEERRQILDGLFPMDAIEEEAGAAAPPPPPSTPLAAPRPFG